MRRAWVGILHSFLVLILALATGPAANAWVSTTYDNAHSQFAATRSNEARPSACAALTFDQLPGHFVDCYEVTDWYDSVLQGAPARNAAAPLRAPKIEPSGIALGELASVSPVGVAANTASLEARAAEIHGALDPIAQSRRTTAALGTQEGTTVIGGGVRDLSPAQRALLQDGEMMAGGPGHAEVTTVLGARGAGLTPQEIVTTTNICPACQVFLRNEGATITGPRSAKW